MTTGMSNPWEASPDESYWQVLLNDVERSGAQAARPSNPRELTAETRAARYDEKESSAAPSVRDEVIDAWDGWDQDMGTLAQDWEHAATLFETKERADLEVVGYNRGGLLVRFSRIQGFVPASQLLELPRELETQARQTELASRIGQKLCLRVIELDRDRNRLIFSERAAASDQRAEAFLETLNEGDVYPGSVTSLCGFGAFVDLGGLEGFIHISELSWGRVNHPSDVLKPGDQIQVYVMGVEVAQCRVTLSLKRLKPDPWTLVDERFEVDQLVEGQITNVVSFGAFVRVDEGLEGLIHISELAEGNFLHPRNVVSEGDWVTVRILNIDSANHRLGLSLRQVHNHNQRPTTQF